jgi:hypothetical protein
MTRHEPFELSGIKTQKLIKFIEKSLNINECFRLKSSDLENFFSSKIVENNVEDVPKNK